MLVVEDDPGVRDLIARALSRGGYTTVTATNAEEARRIAQEMADPPDLVLADVVLPGGGGPELIAQIASPGTRVLFMSGYSVDYFRGRGWKADVLEKPFTVHDLLHSVERTLTAAPGS